jgi:hypothetical protein
MEDLLSRRFGVEAEFGIDEALARLKGLDLLGESGGCLSVPPLPDAIERIEKEWSELLRPNAGSR